MARFVPLAIGGIAGWAHLAILLIAADGADVYDDSSWFWQSYLVMFVVAFAVGRTAGPSGSWLMTSTALMVLPLAGYTVLFGAVLYDGSDGASFWLLGLVMQVFLWNALAIAAALAIPPRDRLRRGMRDHA